MVGVWPGVLVFVGVEVCTVLEGEGTGVQLAVGTAVFVMVDVDVAVLVGVEVIGVSVAGIVRPTALVAVRLVVTVGMAVGVPSPL